MASLLRVVAIWDGFPSSPGYTNLYWGSAVFGTAEAQIAADKVRTFFNSIATNLPLGVTVRVQPTVSEINDADGQMTNEYTVPTPPLAVTGGGAATRSAPSGASVNWRTSTIVRGRRLRGRSFIVPLSTAAYQDDGTLTPTCHNGLLTAAAAMVGGGLGPSAILKVWSRPGPAGPGTSATVTSSSVTDRAAMLTSRR